MASLTTGTVPPGEKPELPTEENPELTRKEIFEAIVSNIDYINLDQLATKIEELLSKKLKKKFVLAERHKASTLDRLLILFKYKFLLQCHFDKETFYTEHKKWLGQSEDFADEIKPHDDDADLQRKDEMIRMDDCDGNLKDSYRDVKPKDLDGCNNKINILKVLEKFL